MYLFRYLLSEALNCLKSDLECVFIALTFEIFQLLDHGLTTDAPDNSDKVDSSFKESFYTFIRFEIPICEDRNVTIQV